MTEYHVFIGDNNYKTPKNNLYFCQMGFAYRDVNKENTSNNERNNFEYSAQ